MYMYIVYAHIVSIVLCKLMCFRKFSWSLAMHLPCTNPFRNSEKTSKTKQQTVLAKFETWRKIENRNDKMLFWFGRQSWKMLYYYLVLCTQKKYRQCKMPATSPPLPATFTVWPFIKEKIQANGCRNGILSLAFSIHVCVRDACNDLTVNFSISKPMTKKFI